MQEPSDTTKKAKPASRIVGFRLSETDHEKYQAKLAKSGLKPGEFFLALLAGAVIQGNGGKRKASVDKKRLIYLFNKASNNINQLAKRANTAQLANTLDEATFQGVLGELEKLSSYMKSTLQDVD